MLTSCAHVCAASMVTCICLSDMRMCLRLSRYIVLKVILEFVQYNLPRHGTVCTVHSLPMIASVQAG